MFQLLDNIHNIIICTDLNAYSLHYIKNALIYCLININIHLRFAATTMISMKNHCQLVPNCFVDHFTKLN